MIDGPRGRRLIGQALFVLLFLILLFLRLMPLTPGRAGWPGPDLGLCLTLVWVLRRPEQAPVALIALLFLVEDVLLWKPLGLWTAIVVLGSEAARRREHRWRELPFMVEWARVAMLVAVMILANRIVLALFFHPLPALGPALLQYIATVAAYPLVAGVLHWPLGLSRTPTES